jgi:hypothetical protein
MPFVDKSPSLVGSSIMWPGTQFGTLFLLSTFNINAEIMSFKANSSVLVQSPALVLATMSYQSKSRLKTYYEIVLEIVWAYFWPRCSEVGAIFGAAVPENPPSLLTFV